MSDVPQGIGDGFVEPPDKNAQQGIPAKGKKKKLPVPAKKAAEKKAVPPKKKGK